MCWTHGLYDGILFVYTHGLLDFTTPLQELLRIVITNVRTAAKVARQLFEFLRVHFNINFLAGFGAARESGIFVDTGPAACRVGAKFAFCFVSI
jgi:hypothetical protein